MSKKKVSVGLDIGVASVGWSIVDIDNKEIVRAGVRLFEEAGTGNSAEDTRLKRGSRRLGRRKNLRKRDFFKLAIEKGFINDNDDVYNFEFNNITMLELRQKALNEGVSKLELTVILLNYLKHRGTFSFWDEVEAENSTSKSKPKTPYENKFAQNILPIERQIQLNNEFGKFRGLDENYTDEKGYIVPSLFTHDQYIEELEKMFEVQIKNNICDENFKNDFFEIFNRKRHYSDGPGKASKNKNSKFGWDKGEFIDRLVGKDTYDRNERRAPKNCLTSYIFNALNDFNNICFSSGIEVTEEKRVSLIKLLIEGEFNKKNEHKTYNVTLAKLTKFLNLENQEQIKGYRISGKNDDFTFTQFTAVHAVVNSLKNENLDFEWINYNNYLNNNLDKVFEILTNCQTFEDRKENLKKEQENFYFLTDEIIECIAKVKLSGTHSLSIKTMKSLIEIMIKENKNHMKALQVKNMKPDYGIEVQNHTNLKSTPLYKKIINEMFISPIVKRALIESIKVVKEIEKFAINEDLDIEYLVIELARENNDAEARKMIKDFQKRNEENNKELIEKYNIGLNTPWKTKLKLRLYTEQNGKSIYSGNEIDLNRLINEEKYCEIDHIIPISFSFDDSLTNKVLCLSTENHSKSNRTPYEWLSSSDYNDMRNIINSEYSNFLSKTYGKKYALKKVSNLLNEEKVSDIKNMIKFINRNLNDTRYATNEVKNYFSFIRKEFKDVLRGNFKIRAINGSFTSYLRKEIFSGLDRKDRDQYKHHGVDATLIAFSPIIKLSKTMNINEYQKIALEFKEDPDLILNSEEDYEDFKKLNSEYHKIAKDINGYEFNFTKKVYKRVNTQITDDTIYSLKKDDDGKLYQIDKINIFGSDTSTIKKLVDIFHNGNDTNVYMKNADLKTFNYLKDIFEEYHCKVDNKTKIKNPFIYYRDDLKQIIHKQSNEIKPPLIKNIKIRNTNEVNSIYDISDKFKNVSKNKVVAFKSPKAIAWDCFYSDELKKFAILPIDVRVLKMGKPYHTRDIDAYIDKDKYQLERNKLKIGDSYIFKKRFFKYDKVSVINKKGVEFIDFVITGYSGGSNNQIEIKPINERTEKRYQLGVTSLKEIKLKSSNILANKINILDLVK